MNYSVEKMISLGGHEWTREGAHRIYFNVDATAALIGFEYGLRKGRVSYARINGESISNNRGHEIFAALDFGKIWYDMADGQFHAKDMSKTLAQQIVDAIKTATAVEGD